MLKRNEKMKRLNLYAGIEEKSNVKQTQLF